MTGISLSQLFSKTIPRPIHTLKYGEDIPEHIMEALRNGETAMLKVEPGEYLILMDCSGKLREVSMEKAEAQNIFGD